MTYLISSYTILIMFIYAMGMDLNNTEPQGIMVNFQVTECATDMECASLNPLLDTY